jgi:hypothetical protein
LFSGDKIIASKKEILDAEDIIDINQVQIIKFKMEKKKGKKDKISYQV